MFYANHVEREKACAVTMDSEHNNWCLDSGCTKHLCKDKEKFIELQPSEHKKLSLTSHMSANVGAKGNVQIQTYLDNNNIKDIEFQDTLYVPDLRVNLASAAKITERDNVVIFTKHGAVIKGKDGRIKAKANRVDKNIQSMLEVWSVETEILT